MTARRREFPQPASSPRQTRPNGADGDLEGDRRFLVRELRPYAERQHILVALRERAEMLEERRHPALVRETILDVCREVGRRRLPRKARERASVPALSPPAVADDKRGDPVEPCRHHPRRQALPAPPPRLEEDDRQQVLRDRPVRRPAEAEGVDRLGVSLEERRERLGVAASSSQPQLVVVSAQQYVSPEVSLFPAPTTLMYRNVWTQAPAHETIGVFHDWVPPPYEPVLVINALPARFTIRIVYV